MVVGMDAVGAAGAGADIRPGGAAVRGFDETCAAAVVGAARVDDAGIRGVNGHGVVVPTLAVHVLRRRCQLRPGGAAVGRFHQLVERALGGAARLSGTGDGGIDDLAIGFGNRYLDVAIDDAGGNIAGHGP